MQSGKPQGLSRLAAGSKHAIAGYVLVGGQSRRFGSDKALATYRGRPLVFWAVHVLQEVGLQANLVGPDLSPYRKWVPMTVTGERPGLGPAEGVRACLANGNAEWSLILGVDMPGVTADVLKVMLTTLQKLGDPCQVICFGRPGGRRHPFPGLYARSLLSLLSGIGPGGSLQRLLDVSRVHLLGPANLPGRLTWGQAFHNVNLPSDLNL